MSALGGMLTANRFVNTKQKKLSKFKKDNNNNKGNNNNKNAKDEKDDVEEEEEKAAEEGNDKKVTILKDSDGDIANG